MMYGDGKLNALNAMLNTYNTNDDKYIDIACYCEDKNVREMAIWVKEQVEKL